MLLLNGDCLELMKTLPDKSIDLFICDLPYGCLSSKTIILPPKTYVGNHGVSTITGCSWDIKIDLDKFWEQVERLMKDEHTPIIHFCNTRFGYDLIKSKEKWFRYDLVWSKSNGVGFLCANKQPLRSHENIYVFSKKGARYNRIDIEVEGAKEHINNKFREEKGCYGKGDIVKRLPCIVKEGKRCPKSVIEINNKKAKGQHPTAKPIDLYKFLIERYSKEGDTVLDPTFGSGNSARACVELKREYIGIEKDEKFFKAFSYYTE
jgi:site-specific DNA-methyltransferase (adenine-specific)